MSTRFFISPAVCSASDKDGTTILNVERGLVYSLIGIASRAWASLIQHPQGLTLEEIITSLDQGVPQIERRRLQVDTERLLVQLQQKELVHTTEWHKFHNPAREQALFCAILKAVMSFVLDFRLNSFAAFLHLLLFDVTLSLGGFRALHNIVRNWPLTETTTNCDEERMRALTAPMERAIRCYPRNSLCLQRSAALTCLLRDTGVPAEMVIACRRIPFKGHAWVEVQGKVVNDSSRVQVVCNTVLSRC